jgi:hypothetical protein
MKRELRVKKSYPPFQRFWTTDAGLTGILVFIILFLVSSYLLDHYYLAKIICLFSITLLFLSGVLSVYHRPLAKVLFGAIALLASSIIWADSLFPDAGLRIARVLAGMFSVGFLSVLVLTHVFSQGAITYHRICGAIAVYLFMAFIWSDIYFLIFTFDHEAIKLPPQALPESFEKLQGNMIYFSVVTVTTLGYGDILPVSPGARLAVMLQALLGQLYPTVMLAWLVSMEIFTKTHKD